MKSAKISINSIVISNIPLRTNRIFLKFKCGKYSFTTQKYQITKDNKVEFTESMIFKYKFIHSKKHNNEAKSKTLRFSFRLENNDGTKYKRYGVYVLRDLCYDDFTFSDNLPTPPIYQPNFSLEKCKEKPNISCDITLLDYINTIKIQQSEILHLDPRKHEKQSDPIIGILKNNDLEQTNHPQSIPSSKRVAWGLQHISSSSKMTTSTSSTSESNSSSTIYQIPISPQRYSDFEKKVDELLADVINTSEEEWINKSEGF